MASFWIRRASEAARSSVGDVKVDIEAGAVDLRASRQKNEQYGLGQLPQLLEAQYRGETCPVRLHSGWMWLRSRVDKHRDQSRRTPGHHVGRGRNSVSNAPSPGLGRGKFGWGMAPVGVAAAWEKSLEGRGVSPRELSMAREAWLARRRNN